MKRRRRINPKEEAERFVDEERDKEGLYIKYISAFKGRGIFTSVSFDKGDFLLEYRGELISKQECERRLTLYHDSLKVFMFEFQFNGKQWCVDAAKDDGSFGRLVNDDHVNPNAKMKFMTVNGKPHLCLFAVRDISSGEEITYNYGDSDWPWRCKETTESSQTETTVSKPKLKSDVNTNQTSSEALDVCLSGQDVKEDILEEIPEAMNSSPTAEDFEKMVTNSSQSEKNVHEPNVISDINVNQTSSALRDLCTDEQMVTNSSQSEKNVHEPNVISDINVNQTSSALGDLCTDEQMVTNSSQSEKNVHEPNVISDINVNQTSSALGDLCTDEQMVTNSSQSEKNVHEPNVISDINVNQTSSALGDLCTDGQMTTENIQDQTTSPTQMSPILGITMCQKHQLVHTTVSSLDMCLQCVGPVSSSKWLGYKCKVCSGIWHKSCLQRITQDNTHHLIQEKHCTSRNEEEILSDSENVPHSEVDQISEYNETSSGEEYIPDSQSEDEHSDANQCSTRNQLAAAKFQIRPLPPENAVSYKPSTCIQVLPSTSNVSKASKTSDSAKDKPEDEPVLSLQEPLTMSRKNYCYVCGKPQSKIARHLKTHSDHVEIAQVFALPEDSKERKIMLEKLRNKGNFIHNTSVLQDGKGSLKVKRKTKTEAVKDKFVHCMHCQGMYIRKELWRHVRRCPCRPESKDINEDPGRTKVLGMAVALQSASCQQISIGVWKLIGVMKQDDVSSVVRNDWTIIQFAQSLYNKHGQDPTKYEYMRQKLREVGRLLLCLRSEFSVANLEEAVKPANFQRVVQAVKKISGFDEETHSYKTPSLALKLGHTLGKICDIIHCRALMAEDDELIKSTDIFKKLHSSKWSELVSHTALTTLSDAKFNKPSTLPFTEDVKVFHQYLERSAESAFRNLMEEVTTQNYSYLAQVTLAQIIVFNRRRAGEVSKMRLKNFHERDTTKLHEDVAMGLSKIEQKLCNYFSRIEIMGKRGRKVAVLLTPSMVDALSLLVSKRAECDVCDSNVFLFARPKSMSHYRGQDSLRVHASQCGAKHPEYLRSTQLRKHVATLSQVLNLKNNELDQVADFLGHDIRVHRDFYRLPTPTTQLAKISKLLLSMEKGNLASLQGKSLEEIELEDEIMLSDAEAKDSESESEDDGGTASAAAECGTSEPEGAASCSINTQQVHDTGDYEETVSNVTSTVNETVSLSKGKNTDRNNESRRVTKKPWSKAEVNAVMRHFRHCIDKGKLATKNECSHIKLVEGSALAERTVQNIRDFVRNRGIAAKRQSK